MITSIRMNSVASYTQDASIETNKKINLIYGLNGTGKSTISNYLYDLDDENYSKCEIDRDPNIPIIVYNQRFIQENFYVSDNLKGIFSLSKENKEAEEKIAEATREQEKHNAELVSKRVEKSEITDAFDGQKRQGIDKVWEIKTTFTGGDRVLEYCLEGLKGQKEKLFAYLVSIDKPDVKPTKSVQDLKNDVEALKGDNAVIHPSLENLVISANDIESDPIFSEPIVGNSDSQIAGLIDKLGNSDWVMQGVKYIDPEKIEDTVACPFCQEDTITPKLIEDIQNYFDDSYQKNIDKLSVMRSAYEAIRNNLPDVSGYTSHPIANNKTTELTSGYQNIINIFEENIRTINSKIENPKASYTLKSTDNALSAFNKVVIEINTDVKKHNNLINNRDTALSEIKNEFWSVMRWDYDQTISRFKIDLDEVNKKLKEVDNDIEALNQEIKIDNEKISSAQKETVNIDEAVMSINSGLLDLGIYGFSISKHTDVLYKIVRTNSSNDVFHTLSEGEKMIISFLYFCELCKGRSSSEATYAKCVAVIDDPISSMSHIFIFNVGQLIKSIFFKSDRIDQVILLTHSLYFFYELTDTNHDRREKTQNLFRITKPPTGSVISTMKYEEIQNDYQSYWSIINDDAQPEALIANCMRNIVEYFFNFVRKKDLNNVFQMPELQDVKYQAFCRYVNRESHSLGQNILDIKEFDYGVFKDGLRLVFEAAGYSEHYTEMSKI